MRVRVHCLGHLEPEKPLPRSLVEAKLNIGWLVCLGGDEDGMMSLQKGWCKYERSQCVYNCVYKHCNGALKRMSELRRSCGIRVGVWMCPGWWCEVELSTDEEMACREGGKTSTLHVRTTVRCDVA